MRRLPLRSASILGGLLLTAAATMVAVTAPAAAADTHGRLAKPSTAASTTYTEIINYKSSRCLSVRGGGTANGTLTTIHSCADLDDQNWRWGACNSLGFCNVVNKKSTKCLSVQGGSTVDGTPTTISDCVGHDDQRWAYLDCDPNHINCELLNYKSVVFGPLRCLSVQGGSTVDGTPTTIHNCGNLDDQYWWF